MGRFDNRSSGSRSSGSGFGSRGPRSGSGSGSRFGSRGPDRGRNNFGPREMHKTTCSECKQECEVPFKPTEGKPVYCRDCFEKKKPRY